MTALGADRRLGELGITTIRTLAMDAHNPRDPDWRDRDRRFGFTPEPVAESGRAAVRRVRTIGGL